MPVTLAQITANVATVSFALAVTDAEGNTTQEQVEIVYYPGRITERTIARLDAMRHVSESEIAAAYADMNDTIAGLIKRWDVLEADGVTMFPLDGARLADLPIDFRMQVLSAIMNDLRPETIAPQVIMNGAH